MTSGSQVGAIYTTYSLDLNPLRRAAQEAKQIARQLEADAGALAARQRPIKLIDGAGAAADARAFKQAATEADRALKGAERLERQMRQTADAQIMAARATGDYARALDLVDRELGAAGNDLVRYNQLLARQAQLQRQAAPKPQPVPTPPSGDGGGIGAAAATLGIGFGAAELARGTVEAARYGAQLTQVEKRFNDLAKAGGATGDVLLNALRQASGGEISDANLRLTATKAAIQGVGDSAAELAPLLAIARDRAQALGLDTTQAFNDLVEGIAKAEPEILDNLGITLNLTQVYAEYSKQLGKTANDLTVAEKRTALLTAVLEQAGNIKPPDSNPYERLAVALQNIGDRGAQAISSFFKPLADVTASGLEGALSGTTEGISQAFEAFQRLTGQYRPLTQFERDFAAAVAERLGFQREATNQTQQDTQAKEQEATATKSAADAIREQNIAMAESISKSQEKAIADQQQTELQNALEEAAYRVATGQSTQAAETARLTALYPGLGDQAEILINQQLRLANATDEVTLAKARQAGADRLAAQQAATRDDSGGVGFDSPGRRGTGDVDAVVRAIEEQKQAEEQAAEDLAEARQRQVETFETTAQRVARLRQEEAEALRQNGKQSAEYVNAVTARRQAEQQLADEQERAAAKGAKAATTGARASSTALNTIENRYEDHTRKMRQLQEDYQQDAARSQEDFLLGQSRDREDFERQYRRLLAEGKRFEAAQLKETFEREQSREQQDFDRKRQREAEDLADRQARESEDLGLDTGRTRERAALRGVRVAGGAPQVGASGPSAGPVPSGSGAAAPGAGGGAIRLQIQIAPLAVQVDGQTIGVAAWPTIEQLIDTALSEDLITVQVAAPPQPAGSPLAGPRP